MEPQFIRKLVEIDEKREKIDGIVYRFRRIVPGTKWNREATLYKEIPVFFMRLHRFPGS